VGEVHQGREGVLNQEDHWPSLGRVIDTSLVRGFCKLKWPQENLGRKMIDLNDQLLNLRGYSYQVWEYSPVHSALTIRATNDNRPNEDVYILFGMVEYVEMAMLWDGDFVLATDDEFISIVKKSEFFHGIGIHPLPIVREVVNLYKVERPKGNIFILGNISSIKTVSKS
jgi:hypothetical protein